MTAFDKTRSQVGFSLVEVLVTLVILAFGLLGLAGMQSIGLKNSQGSLVRSQATLLGYDIIDRMRSNCTAALGGDYNVALGTGTVTGTSISATDVNQWRAGIALALTSGQGGINVDASNGVATVTIQWNDSRSTGGSSSRTVTVSGVLPSVATCQGT